MFPVLLIDEQTAKIAEHLGRLAAGARRALTAAPLGSSIPKRRAIMPSRWSVIGLGPHNLLQRRRLIQTTLVVQPQCAVTQVGDGCIGRPGL